MISKAGNRHGSRPGVGLINLGLCGTFGVAERPNPVEKAVSQEQSTPVWFEDARLVEQVQAGETEAYGVLVRKYQDRVFNACWRICGHLDDARDLTQDAFLKGLENISSFRHESRFYTWIFRVAVNLALSHRRKAKTRQTVSLDQAATASGTQAESLAKRVRDAQAEEPERAASDAELQGKVVAALQQLDDNYRAVIVLRDIEGFDYAEIGAILDILPGTVKSRLHRARMALRDVVAPLIARGS
jgi:RNA polymerase sigma-70 factor (ECF subfamily)